MCSIMYIYKEGEEDMWIIWLIITIGVVAMIFYDNNPHFNVGCGCLIQILVFLIFAIIIL